MTDRAAELALNLREVEERIAAACVAADRPRSAVSWVAVSKTWPVEDLLTLLDLGVRDLGESRDQEAAQKAARLAGRDVAWHFLGQVQTNKARSVASYASVVQSADRIRLVQPLAAGADAAGRRLKVLLQVSLDGDPGRGGCLPADLPALADEVAKQSALALAGVMAVAPRGADPRVAFDRLVELATRLQGSHPGAVEVSAGMSGDLEEAVAAGATLLRVGSAVFGPRAVPLR